MILDTGTVPLKPANAEFLSYFHTVHICHKNKNEVRIFASCASHDFMRILINSSRLIRNNQYPKTPRNQMIYTL